jgi:DNA helicase-2/ATP-dependent DNA helicase PcrA
VAAASAPSLTAAQERALTAEGNVLVAAAAGSGKTRVLTGRIVRAVVEQGVGLDAIVAVTFTDKAAQEVRARVARELAVRGRDDLVAGLESASIGTIHGFCTRLLRRYGGVAGIDPGFRVLDGSQAAWLRRRAAEDAIEACTRDADSLRMRARYGDERLASLLLAAWEAASQRPGRAVQFDVDGDDPDAALLGRMHEHMSRGYAAACRAAGGLDFEDLQHGAAAVLANPKVSLELRARYQRVLVDEFQDTNLLQCAIVDAIGDGCTFAVGDEWQSIYRFRSADVRVFRARSNERQPLAMRDNFRSHAQVLELVNGLFGEVFGERYDPVVAGRPGAWCRLLDAHDRAGGAPACELLLAAPEQADARALEAGHVAARIERLVCAGADPGSIAVLLARQTHAQAFEDAIAARGVPVLRAASRGFYTQRQVADVVELLALVRNRADERAALAALAGPFVGLVLRELLVLRQHVFQGGERGTLWQAACAWAQAEPSQLATACARAVRVVEELGEIARSGTLVDVVEAAIHVEGHAERILAGADGRRRYANLRKLVELAAVAVDGGMSDLGRYLDLVRSRAAPASEGAAAIADEGSGSVRILTVHGAKGLEFDHVFVADAGNQGVRTKPKLLVDDVGRVAFEHVDVDGLGSVVPVELELLREQDATASLEEEQRLMYVALTRARRSLCVSASCARSRKSGDLQVNGPMGWMLDGLGLDPARLPDAHPTLPLAVSVHTEAAAVSSGTAAVVRAQAESVVGDVFDPVVHLALASEAVAVPGSEQGVRDSSLAVDGAAAVDGELVHAALARRLVGGTLRRPLERRLQQLVDGVAASLTFARLREVGARPEVPWLAPEVGAVGVPASGRFDALARFEDGTWWIHDYKLGLSTDPNLAWEHHCSQLERYADAAFAGGADRVRLTLQSVTEPGLVHRYDLLPERARQASGREAAGLERPGCIHADAIATDDAPLVLFPD